MWWGDWLIGVSLPHQTQPELPTHHWSGRLGIILTAVIDKEMNGMPLCNE
jgi:hypothetical protein